ncbi:MAG TPA: hypothetical protein VGP12_01705 [Nitrosospira sp.]|nr:hypothetical protein [Nitrosospira sp.]
MGLPLDTTELEIVVQELQEHPKYANGSDDFKKAFDICVEIEHLRTRMDALFDLDELYNFKAVEAASSHLLEGRSRAMQAKEVRIAENVEE